ncbi:MAG: hypothetical protein IJQ04_04855 [Prevotella sp.]|nr:hypothetical protein [Prevotella sp.]
MNVRDITVSQDQPYTDHVSMEGDATDKDIMVKFVFDEAANQLTVSLISYRMIFVFREDVRYKPLIKGRTIRPDQLPYVVAFDPSDKFRISKLFKSTVPKPRKQYVFHRWIDYERLQPAPQEYSMVNDYISQTFDIQNKSNSVVVKLRDVMLMNDISKHLNKRQYEIGFGRDLYTEYRVNIQRNPCFGMEENIASAKAALEGISKSFHSMKEKYGSGTVSSEDLLTVFKELQATLKKQYPRKDTLTSCPELQQIFEKYNMYADSIARMKCKLVDTSAEKGMLSNGVSERMLLSKARVIDSSVARWLLSADPLERRDIIKNIDNIIKTMNEDIKSQGVYTKEQREALSVFREAERYYRNNCQVQ